MLCCSAASPKQKPERATKTGTIPGQRGASFAFWTQLRFSSKHKITDRRVSSRCKPRLCARSRTLWLEAACYRPRRVPGGDGHIEPLPAARLLVGSGHYPLCRGWNRPPETSAPFGGPGCAGCFGTRLEVLGVDGLCRWWGRQAPPIRLPDEACRLGVVGIPCYVPRTGRVPALTD